MTVENGGDQPANDTALPADADTTQVNQGAEGGDNTPADEELDAEGNPVQRGPEPVEVEYEGKKYSLPPELKDAILRQADYTKKTMTVAEERKAVEAEREAVKSQAETFKAVHAESVKVASLDERLAEYEKVDWNTLFATNQELYHQHRFAREQLKEQRDAASRALEVKQGELTQQVNRERGNHVAKAQAEIARLIPEWTPGGELDVKLSKYGTDLGFSSQDLAETALRNPQFVHQLNRLRLYDEAAKKQKTQQTFQQSQQAQPVTRVGGNSGAAPLRTTDATGDRLSTAEWMKREAARVAAKRKR